MGDNKRKSGASGPEVAPLSVAVVLGMPLVGQVLTILSSLSFLLLMMCLPLVGKAGVVVAWARQNSGTFLTVLFVTLGLSVLATASKLMRRAEDKSPFPYVSSGLVGGCVFFLVAWWSGLLSI